MASYTTVCPRNCYSTCTLEVHLEGNRIRRIEPTPANRATPGGACLKGLSYVERQHSPDRIIYPLRRHSLTGSFQRISWDEAFSELTERLLSLREDPGPQSVFYYAGSGTKGLLNSVGLNFWRLYGGCTTTYGDLCWPAGLEATRLTLGENKHSAPWDIVNARLIILWGKNAAETNLHQMVFIEQALDAGAELVVIDPRRTQSAERASLLIQPRPGTDGMLALGLAHLLIRDHRFHEKFIADHVLGFEEFEQLVAPISPEQTSRVTDVPVDQIEQLARWIGSIQPMTINCGYGMQRYTNSGQSLRAILALLAITGNIGVPGAGWIFANLQSHIFGEKDPLALYPPEQPDGKIRVGVSTARLGPDLLKLTDPPLRMIWVERGNPVTQNPETSTTLRAFRQLEYRVVVDQFMTDTAREADLILPSKTLFEQSDVVNAYWHAYLHLKPKILDAPGEVKPESEVYYELARRLGISKNRLEGLIPGIGESEVRKFLVRKLQAVPGVDLDQLEKGPCLVPGHEEVAFADFRFPTPSGRIELVSQEAQRRWGVEALPSYVEPIESVRVSARDEDYLFYLLTPNSKNRIHSQFNNLHMIRQVSPKPMAILSARDAEDLGIETGDRVRVFNDRGELEIEAVLDRSLKRGCVVIPNGWWLSEGGSVNLLSKARETDMGFGAAFHDNLVQVERST